MNQTPNHCVRWSRAQRLGPTAYPCASKGVCELLMVCTISGETEILPSISSIIYNLVNKIKYTTVSSTWREFVVEIANNPMNRCRKFLEKNQLVEFCIIVGDLKPTTHFSPYGLKLWVSKRLNPDSNILWCLGLQIFQLGCDSMNPDQLEALVTSTPFVLSKFTFPLGYSSFGGGLNVLIGLGHPSV